jgi:hypothetical protein
MSTETRPDEDIPGQDVKASTDDKTSSNDDKPNQPSAEDIEKQQEAQLRSKYPGIKGPGSSAFLQKRLSKGTKYFDSGDYNMAKAKVGAGGAAKPALAPGQRLVLPGPTGDAIPTPETVPHKKLNLHQSKLAGLS